jgi:hypothetical protein
MEDTYSPQAVNQARNAFKKKVRKSSATFFYGAMCGFFTTDELDDLLFEASEVARFLLEVEGTTLDIDEEIDIEDRITKVMRGVGVAAKTLLKNRGDEERAKDQPVSKTPSAGASEPGSPLQGLADAAVETGTSDKLVTHRAPDQSRLKTVSPATIGLTADAEIPGGPPPAGECYESPDTGEVPGTDDTADTAEDRTPEDAEGKPALPAGSGAQKDDA